MTESHKWQTRESGANKRHGSKTGRKLKALY